MLTQQHIHDIFNQGMLFFYNTVVLGQHQSIPNLNKVEMDIFDKGFVCLSEDFKLYTRYYGTSKGYKMP